MNYQICIGKGNEDHAHMIVWELDAARYDEAISLVWDRFGKPDTSWESDDIDTLASVESTIEDL